MLCTGFCIIAGVIFARECVDVSTEAFDCLRDLPGIALPSALKKEMLNKVSDSALSCAFVATADASPKADGHGLHPRHICRGNSNAVLETGRLKGGGH